MPPGFEFFGENGETFVVQLGVLTVVREGAETQDVFLMPRLDQVRMLLNPLGDASFLEPGHSSTTCSSPDFRGPKSTLD